MRIEYSYIKPIDKLWSVTAIIICFLGVLVAYAMDSGLMFSILWFIGFIEAVHLYICLRWLR